MARAGRQDDLEPIETTTHLPVMVEEVVAFLLRGSDTEAHRPRRIVDGTLGGAGHAQAILTALVAAGVPEEEILYLGIDRDAEVLRLAAAALSGVGSQVLLVHGRMSRVADLAREQGVDQADGVLLDLGVSSFQLDEASRGFSFRSEAPLDMRMDREADLITARDLVNQLDEETLAAIIHEYGEERFSRRIASGIVAAREQKPISTTRELSAVVAESVPARFRHGRIHVATRTFQALRIATNDELGELANALQAGLGLLAPGGRMVVISFHSLEDRLVKHAFVDAAAAGQFALIRRKVTRATEEEMERNPRSRSAKLRVIERVEEGRAA